MNTNAKGMTEARFDELRRMLEERCEQIAGAVKNKIRDVRADGTQSGGHRLTDPNGMPEADVHDDIDDAMAEACAEYEAEGWGEYTLDWVTISGPNPYR